MYTGDGSLSGSGMWSHGTDFFSPPLHPQNPNRLRDKNICVFKVYRSVFNHGRFSPSPACPKRGSISINIQSCGRVLRRRLVNQSCSLASDLRQIPKWSPISMTSGLTMDCPSASTAITVNGLMDASRNIALSSNRTNTWESLWCSPVVF